MPRKKTIKKRANNSGSIIKLSGTRRKPYAVRVTIGKNEDGLPIRKNLDYFENKQDAQDFLDMYNLMKRKKDRLSVTDEQAKTIDQDLFEKVKNVQEEQKSMLTFEEIFRILNEEKYKNEKSGNNKISWFNNFKKIHKKNIDNISFFDLQDIFDDLKKKGRKEGTLAHMKVLASDIFKYAVIHEYIKRDQDFTSYLDISTNVTKDKKRHRTPFSIEEIRLLQTQKDDMAKFALLFIYTGCRPNELLKIDTKNIFINVTCKDDGIERNVSYLITGSKTEAGEDRIVPIHKTIEPIINQLLKDHNDYLISPPSKNVVNNFYMNFLTYMKELGMNHIPYECRHTFSTLAKLNKVEEFARKRIMGHKFKDLTNDVYTHSIINHLYDEINKIKV